MSRLAYEAAVERLDKAEERIDSLLDHVRRMDRLEHGVKEDVIQPKAFTPMPVDLRREFVECWDSQATQSDTEKRLWALYRRTESWEEVRRQVSALMPHAAESAAATPSN